MVYGLYLAWDAFGKRSPETHADFKGIVHPKMKILSLILTLMLFQMRKTFVHLQTQIKIFWWNLRALWHCIDSNATEMFPGLER